MLIRTFGRYAACLVGALSVLLLSTVPMVTTTQAYETNVHLDLTRFLLVQAGIKADAADKIASADEAMDDPEHSAFRSYNNRRQFHFVNTRRLSVMRAEAFQCDVGVAGSYFHALEDAFSHEGFGPVLGHVSDPTVDWADWDVPKALEMAKVKFSEIGSFRNSCPQYQSLATPKNWGMIADKVQVFLRDRTKLQ
jgi:hypothetical protein